MAKLIKFPGASTDKRKDPRSVENLTKIYADCRRRNVPYPLAVFDELDDDEDLDDLSTVDVQRERTRDRE